MSRWLYLLVQEQTLLFDDEGKPQYLLGISEDDVVKHVMLKDTVDGEFTTTADVAEAVLYCAGSPTKALTGQSIVVSHGWFMQ